MNYCPRCGTRTNVSPCYNCGDNLPDSEPRVQAGSSGVELEESSGPVGVVGVLPKKPKYGAACNGCGICCAVQLCQLAEIAFKGASAPCPALKLVPDGSRTYCELVAFEKFDGMEPMLETALGIGLGCSMEDDE